MIIRAYKRSHVSDRVRVCIRTDIELALSSAPYCRSFVAISCIVLSSILSWSTEFIYPPAVCSFNFWTANLLIDPTDRILCPTLRQRRSHQPICIFYFAADRARFYLHGNVFIWTNSSIGWNRMTVTGNFFRLCYTTIVFSFYFDERGNETFTTCRENWKMHQFR